MPMYSHVSTTLHFSRNYKRTLPPSPPCSFAITPRRIQFPLRSLCVQHITQLAHTERHVEENVRVIFLTCASLTLADHQQWRYCWQAVCDTALRWPDTGCSSGWEETRRDASSEYQEWRLTITSPLSSDPALQLWSAATSQHTTYRSKVRSWWAWW